MCWLHKQWGELKTAWTEPRGWWSEVQSPIGVQQLEVYARKQYWFQSCSTSSSLMICMMQQSIRSASFQITELRGAAVTQKGHAAILRDLSRVVEWAGQEPYKSSTRRSAKTSIWGKITLGISICQEPSSWKAAWQKRPGGSYWTPRSHELAACPWCKEGEWHLGLY